MTYRGIRIILEAVSKTPVGAASRRDSSLQSRQDGAPTVAASRQAGFLRSLLIAGLALFTSVETSAQQEKDQTLIEAQALGSALQVLAEEYDLQVLFESAVVENYTARAIPQGTTRDAALGDLLSGTDLTYEFVNERTVAIRGGEEKAIFEGARGDSDSKNSSPTPMLMAQSQTPASAETSRRSDESGTSIVNGKVTDVRTGTNLKGAKVTIEETGQWTGTNDLGEFRFVNVPTGAVTLTVSYLGYAGQSAIVRVYGSAVTQSFALQGGDELAEIVVYGQRSARALALNRERTSENISTILAADILGRFPSTTVSEALRRAPAVAFQQDQVGEGTNIIIRGLAPDFNLVKIDGVRLPIGSGRDRSASLASLLTESISEIAINKTLLPNHDSAGTGGLVEITTKSPLDRERRFASFRIQGGRASDDFNEDRNISGTVSGIFGAEDNFGLGLSVQYRDLSVKSLSHSSNFLWGEFLPLDGDGNPITSPIFNLVESFPSIDPRIPFPFDPGVDEVYPGAIGIRSGTTDRENLAITANLEWQLADHTNLRFTYQRSESTSDVFSASFNLGLAAAYELLPIQELEGEERGALVWEDTAVPFDIPGGLLFPTHGYFLSEGAEDNIDLFSIQGKTVFDDWEISYSAGHTVGERKSPQTFNSNLFRQFAANTVPVDPAFLQPAVLNNTRNGRWISPFAPRTGAGLPLPLFTPAGWAFYNDPASYEIGSARTGSQLGENTRSALESSIKRHLESHFLDYLEVGAFYEDSEFQSVLGAGGQNYDWIGSTPTTAADLGLRFSEGALDDIGQPGQGFLVVGRSQIAEFARSLGDLSSGSSPIFVASDQLVDPRLFQAKTNEQEFAFYVQASGDIGPVQVIGGARLSRVDVRAVNLRGPTLIDESGVPDLAFQEQNSTLVDQKASDTVILPRLSANYRLTDKVIFRAGYSQAVARPAISQLSDQQFIFLDLRRLYGPSGNQPQLTVIEGNPALKPAITDSYDLGAELYFSDIGQVKFSVFYKDIDNLLQDNERAGFDVLSGVELPDHPRFENLPSNILVVGTRPINSEGSASIWGGELAIEKQFTDLPRPFDGLGVFANYTYTESKKEEVFAFLPAPTGSVAIGGVDFNQQPQHSGTAAVTFNKFGIDASLAYSAQSDRLRNFRPNGLSAYDDEVDSLDFRFAYQKQIGNGLYEFVVEATDLLKGSDDPEVLGYIGGHGPTPQIYSRGVYLGGRTLSVGIQGVF